MRTIKYAVLVLCLLIAPVSLANADQNAQDTRTQLQQLHWIKGPQPIAIAGVSKLTIPDKYVFLNPKDGRKFATLLHNPPEKGQYYLVPINFAWFAIFHFAPVGYVPDSETLDPDKVLSAVKQDNKVANEERVKKGWGKLDIIGWNYKPRYNHQTKRLEWAINARDEATGDLVTNYQTRILGRRGVMAVTLVTAPGSLETAVNALNADLDNFHFDPDQVYSAYKPGDKVAKYGLMGLIAGGAVAVAAKTGILKWLFKFIYVGIAAVAGAIATFFRKLFGREKKV